MPERCPLLDGLAVVEIGEGIALAYAGRILADLGASVVKVDPEADEVIRPRRGLSECLNAGKVTLAVGHGDDGARAALASAVDGADVLLVSDHTAPHAALGRSAADLRAHRPELIVGHCRP
ncbi:MAG TPA: CoA transferase, partial [Acidimicrobiia bacterium]|nr:CoA transferase [Acidimicrobiia bacterium]